MHAALYMLYAYTGWNHGRDCTRQAQKKLESHVGPSRYFHHEGPYDGKGLKKNISRGDKLIWGISLISHQEGGHISD